MKLEPCRLCGGEVVLRGYRVKIRKRRALAYHVEHVIPADRVCKGTEGFRAIHRPRAKGRNYERLITRWNAAQQVGGQLSRNE